jgi:hypothetical protein
MNTKRNEINENLFTVRDFNSKLKKGKKEENIQIEVCNYLKSKYPDVIFSCDMSSGMKMPIWLAARNKKMRSSRGQPDMFIAAPRGGYHGLFIELKREGVKTLLKDGSIPKDEHLKEQHEMLSKLSKIGYKAVFAHGFNETKEIIDNYLKTEPNEHND